ncbi:MAG TPA: SDR family oxidoreductase [Terriglobia bacterium]|nr:SDR family oxidoreductase [Terriglobia bacterium]
MPLERVFVTGVTGFLGSHLASRLLKRGYHVTALARGGRNASGRERALATLARVVDDPQKMQDYAARFDALEGDIAKPQLGLSDETIRTVAPNINAVWHCAASLSFTEENRDEIFRMNVDGAENTLQFAARTRGRRLHHVSTAYIAGKRAAALESEIDTGQEFRNAYEESKCQAEKRLARAMAEGEIRATVYRPAIVIGESATGRVTHFHGVYAFIRGLWTALERARRKMPSNGTVHFPMRVPGSDSTTLNFVPIDYVADAMAFIGADDRNTGGTFHLSNPSPTPNGEWLPNVCRLLGVEGIRFVPPAAFQTEPITRFEALFQRQMAFYYMYLQGEPRFDCRQTLAALEGSGICCPPANAEFIQHMIGWFVNYLKSGGDASTT